MYDVIEPHPNHDKLAFMMVRYIFNIITPKINLWLTIHALFISIFAANACAETVKIAVATNFTDAMKQIALAFEHDTGHQTKVSHASSGKLFAQILHGAPFDVFLSADAAKPAQLVTDQLAVNDSRFTYALGKLALWAPGHTLNHADARALLSSSQFSHLAIANTKLAPYGIAALQTLNTMDLYTVLQAKLVQGENIGHAYQYIASGNAELGFIAYSQLIKRRQAENTDHWIIPETMHSAIQQDAVLLTRGKNNAAAIAFMRYLKTKKAKAIITSFGYATPQP